MTVHTWERNWLHFLIRKKGWLGPGSVPKRGGSGLFLSYFHKKKKKKHAKNVSPKRGRGPATVWWGGGGGGGEESRKSGGELSTPATPL